MQQILFRDTVRPRLYLSSFPSSWNKLFWHLTIVKPQTNVRHQTGLVSPVSGAMVLINPSWLANVTLLTRCKPSSLIVICSKHVSSLCFLWSSKILSGFVSKVGEKLFWNPTDNMQGTRREYHYDITRLGPKLSWWQYLNVSDNFKSGLWPNIGLQKNITIPEREISKSPINI